MTTILADSDDFHMDEQQTLPITVFAKRQSDDSPIDFTNATIKWVATKDGSQLTSKDTATMTIMVGPQTASLIQQIDAADPQPGDYVVKVTKVAGFGADGWGRPIADFAPGNYVNIADSAGHQEVNVIARIDPVGMILTMTNPLANTYATNNAAQVAAFVTYFSFTLLAGDTILPATKTYGTEIVYDHIAIASWTSMMSPGNIYAIPASLTVLRGKLYVNPIPDMTGGTGP